MNTLSLSHLSNWFLIGTFCAVAGLDSTVQAQATTLAESGALTRDDPKFDEGEHYDHYTFEGIQGQSVLIDLRSNDFDPFLQVHSLKRDGTIDRNRTWFNDDFEGSQSHSRLEIELPTSGSYIVYATSYEGGETGRYELTITSISGRVETGKLGGGDERLQSGEFFDSYEFRAERGETFILDLHSEQFDTYLFVRRAGDPEFGPANDDYEGDTQRSQIVMSAPARDVYTVYVTSFEAGEVGRYQLSISSVAPSAIAPPDAAPVRRESGALTQNDATLTSGEFVDRYEFQGAPGQRVEIRLESDAFDPYLILWAPFGDQTDNDDFEGSTSVSVISMTLDALGTYQVGVTSFEPGSTGAYELTIDLEQGEGDSAAPDVVELTTNGSLNGTLADGDLVVEDRLSDLYSIQGFAGQRLVVRMMSSEFDPVIVFTDADGDDHVFDDASSDSRDALLDMELTRTARYRLRATSYATGAAGRYTLRVSSEVDIDDPRPPDVAVSDGQRIFGVFVGISDYNGDGDDDDGYPNGNDLQLCREDAESLHAVFREELRMRPDDAVLLTDRDATAEAVRDALVTFGRRADDDDMLFFFYSGHGTQINMDTQDAVDLNDPDGTHEALFLYNDGIILDDEMSLLLNGFSGLSVVALDSCFSGGFNKNVISAPGRFGLFSSEEVVTSTTAGKFQAGGHLSVYLRWALRENRVEAATGREPEDDNPNDAYEMTAFELSQFIDAMYEQHVVTSKGGDSPGAVDLGSNLSFQNLVTGWGGIRPGRVLFRWDRE